MEPPTLCSLFQRLLLPSQPASLAVLGFLPKLLHPAGLLSPHSSCSFPVVLLAEGMLGAVGGLLPLDLSSPYYSSLQPIPWGLIREAFSLIFYPMEIIPPLVRGIFACISLGGLTPPFFPSLLDALEVGSFVSLAELCWSGLVRRVVWVPEPSIRYLGPDCPAPMLCDFQDSTDPLWASRSFICPVLVVRGHAC